jgi:hypothetical protein
MDLTVPELPPRSPPELDIRTGEIALNEIQICPDGVNCARPNADRVQLAPIANGQGAQDIAARWNIREDCRSRLAGRSSCVGHNVEAPLLELRTNGRDTHTVNQAANVNNERSARL